MQLPAAPIVACKNGAQNALIWIVSITSLRWTRGVCARVRASACVCVRVRVCVCVCVCAAVCLWLCMCVCARSRVYVLRICVSLWLSVCLSIFVCRCVLAHECVCVCVAEGRRGSRRRRTRWRWGAVCAAPLASLCACREHARTAYSACNYTGAPENERVCISSWEGIAGRLHARCRSRTRARVRCCADAQACVSGMASMASPS